MKNTFIQFFAISIGITIGAIIMYCILCKISKDAFDFMYLTKATLTIIFFSGGVFFAYKTINLFK